MFGYFQSRQARLSCAAASGRPWITALVLLAGLALLAGCALPGAGNQAAEAQPTATPQPVRAASQVVADAAVVPVLESSLSMPAGGIVQEVLVAEGDTVEAGQPLLRLRSLSQQAAVAQAEAGVARAQARVDELKAGPRPEEITVAQAAVDVAAAGLDKLSARRQG